MNLDMKDFKYLNEQDEVYSEAHARELLQVKANYNKKLQELNNQLAKQIADLSVKYMKIAQAQQQLAQSKKAAAKVAGTQQPTTQPAQTGTVNTAGQPVSPNGTPTTTQESYTEILKVRRLDEEKFDTSNVSSEEYEDLKNYLDAENIPYVEDEDETSIDFDSDELDPEWKNRLDDIGLEPIDDVKTDDILDIEDEEDFEEDTSEEDITDEHEKIDVEKVFHVKVKDGQNDFIGKIYKLFDDGDWRAKVIDGESNTFEKLNYDPDWDDIDIIAFLRENYDDAELISEDEYNEIINNRDIKESHKIPSFDDYYRNSNIF